MRRRAVGQPFDDLIATGAAIDVLAPDPRRDGIDGLIPGAVVVPHSAEAVAATLLWASERYLSLVIRGGGTKAGWGRRPARLDLLLDMRGLNRVIVHRHGDLTVTVEAGASLRELNHVLGIHGQWLPLDPPFAGGVTIGGILATNDSGPLRHRFGTPRDLVIGIHLATTDGRLTKAGGQVVKNVAGYDLSKLVSGSFGALAVITAATFKLSPLPAASSTIRVTALDSESIPELVQRLAQTQLEPVAFELHVSRGTGADSTSCLLQFASTADAVDAQIAEACARIDSDAIEVTTAGAERELWDGHATRLWDVAGTIARASWLPADLAPALRALDEIAADCPLELIGRAGVGAGLIRLGGHPASQIGSIERLRSSRVFGNVAVVRAPAEVKSAVDVWPPIANSALLSAIKREMDPNGTLGGGRGPV